MIPSLFALACTPDTPEPADPAERIAVCVGEGELDVGVDGVVERYLTHQLGDGWSELLEETADGTATEARIQTFDARGQPLTDDYAVSTPERQDTYSATWVRDPDGILRAYLLTDSFGFDLRDDYIYEGGLLARVERRLSGEAAGVELYEHDDAGRVVERRGDAIGVIRWDYFAPAPALDARMTQDWNDDGLVDAESSSFYDRAGRPIFLSSTRSDDSWTTTAAHEYGPTGDEVWSLRVSEYTAGTRTESETSTERDEDGHPLRVESVNTTVAPGVDEVVSEYLTTWTWDCTD